MNDDLLLSIIRIKAPEGATNAEGSSLGKFTTTITASGEPAQAVPARSVTNPERGMGEPLVQRTKK